MERKKAADTPVIRIEEFYKFNYENLNRLQREKCMFLLMSNDHDADMVLGHAEMTENDYKRILYILECLEFSEYYAYIFKKFYDRIGTIYFSEDNVLKGFHVREQVKLYDSWLRDFIEGVPDEVLKAKVARQIHNKINRS